MAFKITDEQFGQLLIREFIRGLLEKVTLSIIHVRRKVRVGRMVRMNSNDREY